MTYSENNYNQHYSKLQKEIRQNITNNNNKKKLPYRISCKKRLQRKEALSIKGKQTSVNIMLSNT